MFPARPIPHSQLDRNVSRHFPLRFSVLFAAVLLQSLLSIASFLSADFYQRTNFATQLELRLQRVLPTQPAEQTLGQLPSSPFSYQLVFNKKEGIAASSKIIADMRNSKTVHSQFYFALVEDEIGYLRKIERRIIDKGKDSIQTAIWLDRDERVAAIEETLENQLVYRVRFNPKGQITSIKTRLLNEQETLFVENYRYGPPAMDATAAINRIVANNDALESIAPNIFKQTPAIKTIDYYYNGEFVERKLFWGERGKQAKRAVLYFKPLHSKVELKSYEIVEAVSRTQEAVYRYAQDHSRSEILTHRYENTDLTSNNSFGKIVATLSSKNYSIAYRYNASGALEKKTVRDTLTGQTRRETLYQYLPIDSSFSLLFSPNFSSNAVQREIVFFQNEPLSFKKLYQGFFGVLIGLKEIQYLGNSRLKKQTKIEGNRIFSTSVVDRRLESLEIKNRDGTRLAHFQYSYRRDGRIHEETRYGALQENFTKIRYIYDEEKAYLPGSTSTMLWGSGESGKAILSNLAKHRIGLSFLGKSLFRYHLKTVADNGTLAALTALPTKTTDATQLQSRKRIFENAIVRAHMKNIETSGLAKVLFINSYDEVVGYVRVERGVVGQEKPDTAVENPFIAKPVLPEEIELATQTNVTTDSPSSLNSDTDALVAESLQNFSKNLSQISNRIIPLPQNEEERNTETTTPPDPNAVKTLTFTYYGQEPLFFYNTERGFQQLAGQQSIVRDANRRQTLRDGGKFDFRTRANDSVGLFAKEKKLESYTFFYRQDFLPFEATFSLYDPAQGELVSKQTVSRAVDEVTTQNPSFKRLVESALIDIPLFSDEPVSNDPLSTQ